MDKELINQKISEYVQQNWETMVTDLDALVRIPSVEDLKATKDGAPFGPHPRKALDVALGLAERMGFQTHNEKGYIGYADFPGKTDGQIGIIGHMDVVPAGSGWTFEPFQVTRKDGYLIGRGVIDDKGPSVVALHALKFWKDLQDAGEAEPFPYTIRFLFGANEESGMRDVEYYQQHHEDPLFLFTPDAEFPVCYGEKGLYDGFVRAPVCPDGVIVEFQGGVATNAVPSDAFAVVRADAAALPSRERITVIKEGEGLARIEATGLSAHASTPEEGVNAIGLIADYLLDNQLCSEGERAFLELEQKLIHATDGSSLGLAAQDEHFGALTLVAGTICIEKGAFVQSVDVRLPTTMTTQRITEALTEAAASVGGTYTEGRAEAPFLMDAQSDIITTMLQAYNEATGESAQPFTMGGGTYARHFKNAVSFGPEKAWVEAPEWVGGMHGPDEGVSEELLQEAFRIYALTIGKLMELKF